MSEDTPGMLFYVESGAPAAPSVVLLHGLGWSRATWNEVVPGLSATYHVFVVDLRGHGESRRSTGHYRLHDYVNDVIEFLDTTVPGPVVLIGHSLGAVIAHAVAQRATNGVRAVVLEEPPLYGATRPPDRPRPVIDGYVRIRDTLRNRFSGDPSDAQAGDGLETEQWAALAQVDPEVYSPVIEDRGVLGPDLNQPVACPVLVLRADEELGAAFTPEDSARFLLVNPDAEVIEMGGATHFIHRGQPLRFVDAVTTFIRTLS